jgi:hypothetical protein
MSRKQVPTEIMNCFMEGVAGFAALNYAADVQLGQPAGMGDQFLSVLMWVWEVDQHQAFRLVYAFVVHARSVLGPVGVDQVVAEIGNELRMRTTPFEPAMLLALHQAVGGMLGE